MLESARPLLFYCTFISISLVCSVYPTLAQFSGSTTGAISGTVKDTQGKTVVGANIEIKQKETNLERKVKVAETGIYNLSQLPPGLYEIKVNAEGFSQQSQKLTINIGRTLVVNFVLSIGDTSAVIEVNSSAPNDIEKTESSTNIVETSINNLPINIRNFLDFSTTAARVIVDRFQVFGGNSGTSGLSFNGQSGRFNNITIDGLDNNIFITGGVRTTFSQDAIKEFQILSDGYSAEFGRAIGGVVNIVTRGGSNEPHGSLFLFNRSDKTSTRDPFLSFKPPYSQSQLGLSFSGPIKQDKLFFFTSFERLFIKQNNIITISDSFVAAAQRQGFIINNGASPRSNKISSLLVRFDANPTPNYNFWVRYNSAFERNFIVGNSAIVDEKRNRRSDNAIATSGTYTNAKLNLVNETRFLYNVYTEKTSPNPNFPQVSIAAPENSIQLGSIDSPFSIKQDFYQLSNNTTIIRNSNKLKFGIDFLFINQPQNKNFEELLFNGAAQFMPLNFSEPGIIRPSLSSLQSFDPTSRSPEQRAFLNFLSLLLPDIISGFPKGLPLADLPLPASYIQTFGDTSINVNQKNFSFYLQNDINLRPNLIFKAGIRYDLNRFESLPKNKGNFSPRIGVSYQPIKIPNLNIRASYGLFFGSLPTLAGILTQHFGINARLQTLALFFPSSVIPFSMPNHNFPKSSQIPDGFSVTPQITATFFAQPDLKNSYSQQANLTSDYLIGKETVISLSYNFVRGLKLPGVRNINPVIRPVANDLVQGLLQGRVDPTKGELREFESAFDSYYHALTISINRRFANKIGFLASYVFSKNIDNVLPFSTNEEIVTGNPVNPLFPANERGLSSQDTRSRFVFSGVWDMNYFRKPLFKDFQLSAILKLNSGQPYNLLTGVDLDMNGEIFGPVADRPAGLGRNVGITPGFASLDLRLSRSITIAERYKLQAGIEAFNFFNKVNIDPNNINNIFAPDEKNNFLLPPQHNGRYTVTPDRYLGAFAPRQLQLSFRLIF